MSARILRNGSNLRVLFIRQNIVTLGCVLPVYLEFSLAILASEALLHEKLNPEAKLLPPVRIELLTSGVLV